MTCCEETLKAARHVEVDLKLKIKERDAIMFDLYKKFTRLSELDRDIRDDFNKISDALKLCGPRGADL